MSQRFFRPAPSRGPLRLAISGACCALLLVTAGGCGNEADGDGGTATDSSTVEPSPTESSPTESSPTSSDNPTESPSGDPETGAGAMVPVGDAVTPDQALVVSASNVKGQTSTQASALVDDAATDAFLADLDARLANEVRAAAKAVQVPTGSTLFGAVASVGCEEPTSITWQTTFDGIEVRAALPKPGVQCLVPVTSIVLFLVPAVAVG